MALTEGVYSPKPRFEMEAGGKPRYSAHGSEKEIAMAAKSRKASIQHPKQQKHLFSHFFAEAITARNLRLTQNFRYQGTRQNINAYCVCRPGRTQVQELDALPTAHGFDAKNAFLP